MAALNPTDQVFDFEELEYHYLVANRTEDAPSKDDDDDEDDESSDVKDEKNLDDSQTENGPDRSPIIDNPFLKAAKGPNHIKSETSVSLNFN